MYVLTNVAAARFLWRQSRSLPQLLLPTAGAAVAAYVLYRNVCPQPEGPFAVLPYFCAAWLRVGPLATLLVPGLPGRVAAGLAHSKPPHRVRSGSNHSEAEHDRHPGRHAFQSCGRPSAPGR